MRALAWLARLLGRRQPPPPSLEREALHRLLATAPEVGRANRYLYVEHAMLCPAERHIGPCDCGLEEWLSALAAAEAALGLTRADWTCEASTKGCPGTQGSLKKEWICDACGRRAHAPVTWRDKGLASKSPTYTPEGS